MSFDPKAEKTRTSFTYYMEKSSTVIDFLSENGDDKLMEEFFYYINQTDEFHTEIKC